MVQKDLNFISSQKIIYISAKIKFVSCLELENADFDIDYINKILGQIYW